MTQNNKNSHACVVCVHIKKDLAIGFKNKCDAEGITRSTVLRDAILAYLDGRLEIVEKQNDASKPSYFIQQQ